MTGPEPPSLVETMRAEGGRVALWDRHAARLAASAEAWRYPLDVAAAAEAVRQSLGGAAPAEAHRVRLLLAPSGALRADAVPLAGAPFRTACVDPQPLLQAGGPTCVHKTTDRAHYERPFQRARALGADEAILLDADGFVVEGTRTSVWIEAGGRLWTPPRSAGGLPGVLRALLLDTRPDAGERPIPLQDLLAADAVFLSNALRGLMPVRVVPPGRSAV